MIITSRSNKTAKLLRSLSQKKYRDETGLFVVEGKRGVSDVLNFAPELIREIVTSPSLADEYPNPVVFSDELLASVCETVTSYCDKALFLDGLRDPGNIGTLLRTACAAGFGDVYIKDCADVFSGKVVRSTMSAIVKVKIIHADADTPDTLKAMGYTIAGADMDGEDAFSSDLPNGRICLIVGGEADGITDEVKSKCDKILSIPMTGDIESLNAAVSGAVLMYEINRKRSYENKQER